MFQRHRVLVLAGLVSSSLLVGVPATAAPGRFDFKDPKGNNSVLLIIDSPLEPVIATGNGVSGMLDFDPKEPKKTVGKLVIDAASIQFPNAGFTATARGPDGFDVEKFPKMEFTLVEVRDVRASPGGFKANVVGDFTCRGITKRVVVSGEATHQPGKGMERSRTPGDLLVLRFGFKVKRHDFGVKPSRGDSLVGDEVEVRLFAVGTAPTP